MRVRFAGVALADVQSIDEYLSAHAGVDIAERVKPRIGSVISMLRRFPHVGHDGHVSGTHEMLVPRLPFMVVYRIEAEGDELIILRIYHTSKQRNLDVDA